MKYVQRSVEVLIATHAHSLISVDQIGVAAGRQDSLVCQAENLQALNDVYGGDKQSDID
jgi:hypothetical protein